MCQPHIADLVGLIRTRAMRSGSYLSAWRHTRCSDSSTKELVEREADGAKDWLYAR